jgi:hypothetical protein
LDRRTNGLEGSGGASPTIVTSRASGDDGLDDSNGNGPESEPAGITAAPRRTSAQADSGTAAPANGSTTDRTARSAAATADAPAAEPGTNGVTDMAFPAGSADTVRPGRDETAPDDTIVDGMPPLPGDNLGSARGTRPEAAPRAAASASRAADTTDKPAAAGQPGVAAPGAASPGAASSPAAASSGAPAVSPAAFAWDMPDPPPDSPSSPARSFLRSGTGPSLRPGSGAKNAAAATAAPATSPPGPPVTDKIPLASRSAQKKAAKRSARQAHLTVARVEPWSVMKFSFIVSLVAFVVLFVAVSVLYGALAGLGVFDSLQRVVSSVTSSQSSAGVNAAKWWSASRILGYTALLGSLNIVLITAMSTIGAVVYNLTSRLVGGVEVTLRETE